METAKELLGIDWPDDEMKVFTMIRNFDESGVSGTGRVLDGVEFPNGSIVVCWRGEHSSIAIYRDFSEFKAVHIDPHPKNETMIKWRYLDDPEEE